MKTVAAFLVLCCLAVTQAYLRCNQAPQLYGAQQVDAAVGLVVVTTRTYHAYMLIDNRWVRLSHIKVRHVTVGPAGIWAVGYGNKVYRYLWGGLRRARGTTMKQLDAGGGKHLVAVSSSNNAQCLKTGPTFAFNGVDSLTWKDLGKQLKYFSCGPYGACWGVTTRNQVVCVKHVIPYSCTFSPWTLVTGNMVMIEISTHGVVFGVNPSGNVYKRVGISRGTPHGTSWEYIPMCMAIKHVSSDLGKLWAVTRSGLILTCTT